MSQSIGVSTGAYLALKRACVGVLAVLFICGSLLFNQGQHNSDSTGATVAAAQEVASGHEDKWGFHSRIPQTLVGEDAKHDSQMLAGLCDGLAAIIELDGKREAPKLLHAIHMFDLRSTAVMACLGGSPVSAPKYPEFNAVVGEIFSDKFPDGDEPLTEERRAEAVAMFRALAAACQAGGN